MLRLQACRLARADLRVLSSRAGHRTTRPRGAGLCLRLGSGIAETDADSGLRSQRWSRRRRSGRERWGETDAWRAILSNWRAIDARPPLPSWLGLRCRCLSRCRRPLVRSRRRRRSGIRRWRCPLSSSAEVTSEADVAFETWARQSLVALFDAELRPPAGGRCPTQRRLVAMQPQDRARPGAALRFHLGAPARRGSAWATAPTTCSALASGAGDPAVEVALRVMAGRVLGDSPEPRQVAGGWRCSPGGGRIPRGWRQPGWNGRWTLRRRGRRSSRPS